MYEVYGYGDIEALLHHQRPPGMKLREFLAGTIIGTFRRKVQSNAPDLVLYLITPIPAISKVHTSEELAKNGMDTDADLSLPYHIRNQSFFERFSSADVRSFLEAKVGAVFKERSLEYRRNPAQPRKWEIEVRAENFRIYISGSSAGNSKTTLVDFNASPAVQEDLNRIVGRYYVVYSKIKPKRIF